MASAFTLGYYRGCGYVLFGGGGNLENPMTSHYGMTIRPWSQNTRLKGTSRSIWSKLSWQQQGLEKMDQHSVQLNLKIVPCWQIHPFSGEIIPRAYLIVKNFSCV